jgi:hypothetical protein
MRRSTTSRTGEQRRTESRQRMSEADCSREGIVYQIGLPPGRIALLTELTGVAFAEAWPERQRGRFGDIDVDFIGRASFIKNKQATGRPRDLGDIDGL